MSRIQQAFANGKAFIPFLTCGDPDLGTTAALVRTMAEAGADLIELGIPFSDPTAEGPVIQAANARALAGGVTTDQIFGMARALRRDVAVPMVFMTYANVVFSYGTERFLAAAAEAGIDGLILPDVPFEEKEEFAPACRACGLDLISLIAPTSEGRISEIAKAAEGFVYCGVGHRQAGGPAWPGGRARCAGFHRGDEAGGQPEVSGGSMRRPADRFHAVGIMGAQTRNTSTEGQAAGLTGGCMA